MRVKLAAWLPEYDLVDAETEPRAPGEPRELPWEVRKDPLAWSGTWAFIDGVERVDAFVQVEGRAPGLFFSFAVGAALLSPEGASFFEDVVQARVFLSPLGVDLAAEGLFYRGVGEASESREGLLAAARRLRREAEVAFAQRVLDRHPEAQIVHDGTLYFAPGAPTGRLGYVKSLYRSYLDPEAARLLEALRPGTRTPIFYVPEAARNTPRPFFSWYLRLPLLPEAPFAASSGLVRLETDADEAKAVLLARQSLGLFQALATRPYQDPRAPANLLPIAALEAELKRRLGHRDLVRRRLAQALAQSR